MSIQFKADVRPEYVYLSCNGVFSADAFLDVCRSAILLAVDNSRSAALVDVTSLTGDPPKTMQRFYIGEAVAGLQKEYSGTGSIRIAALGNNPMIDPAAFGETVAVNRGANVKVFTDMEQAIRWIENASTK